MLWDLDRKRNWSGSRLPISGEAWHSIGGCLWTACSSFAAVPPPLSKMSPRSIYRCWAGALGGGRWCQHRSHSTSLCHRPQIFSLWWLYHEETLWLLCIPRLALSHTICQGLWRCSGFLDRELASVWQSVQVCEQVRLPLSDRLGP